MGFFRDNKARLFSVIALVAMLALLVPMVSIGGASKVFADTIDYYELKVGEDTVAVLETEEEAYDLITQLRDTYVEDAKNVVDIKMTPAVTVSKVSVPKNEQQPTVENNMVNVLDSLLVSDENSNEYIVQEGDTVWEISMALGMSTEAIQKQNPGLDIENIVPGDKIVVKNTESLINVIVEYEVESEVSIPFETIYEEDPTMDADEEEYVKIEGVKGTKVIKERVVKVNGIVDQVDELSAEIVTEPVSRVVVRGTMNQDDYDDEDDAVIIDEEEVEDSYYDEEESSDESYYEDDEDDDYVEETSSASSESTSSYSAATYSGSGQSVVDYALQFQGNPYVWGGTSLTNGCDCSGFVWRVFNDCGYAISRWPDSDFPHVSASELRPGDITRYGGHYAIYIGNGMEISAVDESQGIRVHPMYYSYSAFWYGIRVIG